MVLSPRIGLVAASSMSVDELNVFIKLRRQHLYCPLLDIRTSLAQPDCFVVLGTNPWPELCPSTDRLHHEARSMLHNIRLQASAAAHHLKQPGALQASVLDVTPLLVARNVHKPFAVDVGCKQTAGSRKHISSLRVAELRSEAERFVDELQRSGPDATDASAVETQTAELEAQLQALQRQVCFKFEA